MKKFVSKFVWSMVVVLGVMSMTNFANAVVINDFEGYIDTPDLLTDLVGTTPNETPTLSMDGHNGGLALLATYNTWDSPWWSGTQLVFGGANGQDWTNMNTLTVWYKVTGAASRVECDLYTCWGTGFSNGQYFATPDATPVGDWVQWNIDISGLTGGYRDHVGRIQFAQVYPTWGGGTVLYDDISVTPEPATLALLGLGGLALIRRKRS
jgi:hypothetical protein